MKPYVYKITSKSGEYYYGARWAYDGKPEDDLLISYFTSSVLIQQMINEYGVEYFTPEIISIVDSPKKCLDIEYSLIKESIDDPNCLNRAMGKCTIWDDTLKSKVSSSVKKLWENPLYRSNIRVKNSAENNHNYNKPPWRNVNGDKKNWYKSLAIYDDFINEKWDFNKYGFGRTYLMKRYDISQGMSRKLITLLNEGWNPSLDEDFIKYYNALVMEWVDMLDLKSNGQ